MAIPTIFSIRGSKAIASYDYFDVAAKVGYKKYYYFLSSISGSTLYVTSPEALAGDPWRVEGNAGSAAGNVKVLDYDFDLEYNNPAIIKGEYIFNGTWSSFSTANTNTGYFEINVYHVDKSNNETLLGSVLSSSDSPNSTSASAHNYYRKCLKVSLSKKKFAIGEKLRVNVAFWFLHSGAGTGYWYIYFDPTDRSTTPTENASMDGYVPYRIDL